jgi:hypothetical protein
MLLALRTETNSAWSLGVRSRVKADEHRQRRFCEQLISTFRVELMLRTLAAAAQGLKAHGALLRSARSSPNGSLHVVASRDMLTGREALEASYGKPSQCSLMRVAWWKAATILTGCGINYWPP